MLSGRQAPWIGVNEFAIHRSCHLHYFFRCWWLQFSTSSITFFLIIPPRTLNQNTVLFPLKISSILACFSDVAFIQTFHFWLINKRVKTSFNYIFVFGVAHFYEFEFVRGWGDCDEGDVGEVQSEDGVYARSIAIHFRLSRANITFLIRWFASAMHLAIGKGFNSWLSSG